MPKGSFRVQLTDLLGEPVQGGVDITLRRMDGEPGTGGQAATVSLATPDPDLTVTNIECRGGIGTMYKVTAETPHYRPYTFFQLIQEDRVLPASDDVEFVVKPGDVADIAAPSFGNLSAAARRILNAAEMIEQRPEDGDLLGLSGEALYRQLGPLRKACLLNIMAKAAHATTVAQNHLPSIRGLLIARQDRCFAWVKGDWADVLRASQRFKSVDGRLHEPPQGFVMTDQSFKSRDAHGNLQVTFMRHIDTDEMAADIDIDKAGGIEHGVEVIGNAVLKNRTNPYAIREILLLNDTLNDPVVPDYRFRF